MNRPHSSLLRWILCGILPLFLICFSGCSLIEQPSLAILGQDAIFTEYASVSKDQLRAAAEQAGIPAETLDIPQNELEQFLKEQPVSALIICLSSSEDAEGYIEAARPSLTPIVFCGVAPSEETMASYDPCWYVGSSPQSEGELLGETLFSCYENGQIPDKNGDKLLQPLVISTDAAADDRVISVLRIFENQGIYSAEPVVLTSDGDPDALVTLLSAGLSGNPQTELVLVEDFDLAAAALSVCTQRGVPVAALGGDASSSLPEQDAALLACSGFNLADAARLIVTYADNASLGKDPTDETGERMSESRCTYLEPLILQPAAEE